MQQNTFKKVVYNICGEVVSLFAYKTYSTLHLAGLRGSTRTKENKELFKLSKKMLKIVTKFPPDNTDISERYYNMENNVKLFYEVYHRMEYLMVKELELLYDYFSILRRQNYFYTMKDNNIIESIVESNQYSENIWDFIERKKIKRKIISRK